MHKFVRNLITEWRRLELPFSDAPIVVAVSGGADSISLLLAIEELVRRNKLTLRIIVAHFNHKLRGKESDADEKFVERCASDLGFEFVSASGKVSKKGNLEQNARDARYKFLTKIALAAGSSIVLTAHTLNDQAETFLMNLIRGSGADGLRAMGRITELSGSPILVARPLLSWARRDDTERYCRDREVRFRSDTMNEDEAFTRVKIRRRVIPLLAELNPKIVETLARTAELMPGSGAQVIHDPTAAEPPKIASLRLLSRPDLYRQLRSWLRHQRGNLRSLNLKHIEAIERLISSSKSGKTAELPGGGRVVKHGGRLIYRNIRVEK